VNETVAVTDALGKGWARALVNALLREAQRREEELLAAAASDYAVWYAHPQWLLDRLKQDWPAAYRDILEANNCRAPMTLRVNIGRISRADYLARLQEAALPATTGQLTSTALLLAAPSDVQRLPGFAEGLVSVQDEASQLAAQLLPLAPELRVLDACAAPGGKTCALLEREPSLQLLALDQDAKRLLRVHENLDRLGLQAEVRCSELGQDLTLAPASFDRILLDVPCSATGVIRRHPDIKLLRSEAETSALVARQSALLERAWTLLAPGGYLLYSTCSVLKAENSDQITSFLGRFPEARLQALSIPGAQVCDAGLQLLPGTAQCDGFFYALLQK
jgi:16S rRNA (cytosine967-C5)-methyltransferase